LQAFTQVCQAVGFAHSRGIIHRDLKPANVMVGAFGEVQVMDWGLAKDLTSPEVGEQVRSGQQPEPSAGTDPNQTTDERPADESTDARTQAGVVMGTPAYMAPEQARGEAADASADVFALGGILCAILTGRPPYSGKSPQEVIRRAGAADLGEAHTRLDGCGADAELVALCRNCLSPSPVDRPKDGQAVAGALTAYLDGVQERLRRAELDRVRMAGEKVAADLRLAEQRRRVRLTLTLAGMAVLLVLGGAVIWVQAQKTWDQQERNADAVAGLLDQVAVALPERDPARARVLLAEADKRAEEGGAERWSERRGRLHEDLKVLEALDKVDQSRWEQVESRRPEPAEVASQFRKALVEFGLSPESVSVEKAAARVSESAVRDRLVTALDWWMRVEERPSVRVRAWVRAVLRAVDPDSYRDVVRDVVLKNDPKKMRELVGRAEAAKQPPGFVAFLGESDAIPVERRRELLTLAVRHRTGDVELFLALGATYRDPKADAEKRLRWLQAAVGVAPRNSAAHHSLGAVLLHNGQFDDAIARFRTAIEIDEEYALAYTNLGNALLGKGQVDDAIKCCRKAIALAPKYAWAYNDLGIALKGKGKVDEAIACYKEALRLDPKYAGAHYNLGIALADEGKLDEAIAAYKKAIELDPNYAEAHTNLGRILCDDKKDYDGAIARFKKAIELKPKLATAHYNLGNALTNKGLYDEAITSFRKAIEYEPKNAGYHNNLANALRIKGEVDESIDCCKKAIGLDPKHAMAYFNLGNALRAKGRVNDAIACYRKAIELDPKCAPAHTNLGIALLGKRQLDEAIKCFHKAIDLDPKLAQPHNSLGNALHDKGLLDEAIASYKKASEINPKYAGAHYNLGRVLRETGRFDAAIASFRKAIDLEPKHAKAHGNLGMALRAKGQVDQAIASYKECIRLDPKLAEAHVNLGGVFCDVKRDYDAAIACFRKAIALAPKDARAHYGLGNALSGKGKLDEAIASFLEAIKFDPKNATAHNNLGNALSRQGKVDQAIASYKKAVELDPKNAKAHFNLGSVFCNVKRDYDAAIACFRKGIELEPKEALAHNMLGNALARRNRLAEAEEAYRKAIALQPNEPDLHFNLGTVLQAQRKTDEAAAAYREVIRLRPEAPKAHCFLGQILRDQGNFAEALKMLRRGHEFGTKQFGWPLPSAQWVREAEQLVAIEARLPAFLKGELQPRDTRERLALAAVCRARKLHATAARLFADAFAADPKLADDLDPEHRYAAARSAVLAAAGKGKDSDKLQGGKRVALRRQALTWLHADLTALGNLLASGPPQARPLIAQALRHWQKDSDLIGIRDKVALAQMSAEERAACAKLWSDVAALLKTAGTKLDPKDARGHTNLGNALYLKGKVDEAIACFEKAIELDPKLAEAHGCLGNALVRKGQVDEGIASLRKAIALAPKLAQAHTDLGAIFCDVKRDYDTAITCFRKAIALAPKDARAHYGLGNALKGKGRLDEAITCFRKAIALDPKYAQAHINLGVALNGKGKADEAIGCFHKAIALDPKLAQAHGALGFALLAKGNFAEAREASARCLELLPEKDPLRAAISRQLQTCQRLGKLEKRLPRLLKGEDKPGSAQECLELAEVCQLKRMNAAAARFSADAFATDPTLADDLQAAHRYNAACFAALAASGKGEDAGKLDGKERARLRKQALDWLKADLALYAKRLKSGSRIGRRVVTQQMEHWQKDTDLTGIRDKEALAKLLAEERVAWETLWADVSALLKKAQSPTQKEGK
jgi:tetratricopeptide (TPR) repeat protein